MPRSRERGGTDDGDPQKPASEPEKPVSVNSGRTLLTADDLRAAIAWRIDGIPAAEVEAIAAALRPLAGDFREARPEVARLLADLRRPGDRRDAWGLACAVLADDALRQGNVGGFWSAGLAVVEAVRQGRRMPAARSPLTEPMRRFKRENPDSSADEAFGAFRTGASEVVTGYVSRDDALQVAGWSNVTRETFVRRYRELS